MAALVCPYCSAHTAFVRTHTWDSRRGASGLWLCVNCDGAIVGTRYVSGEPAEWQPRSAVARSFPDVPEQIAADAAEAYVCRSVGALRAAVVMARRAVQALALEQGAPAGQQLWKQIDWLADQGRITLAMKEVAHAVRITGNAGAHPEGPPQPDELDTSGVDEDEAEDILSFTATLLEHVYQVPAKVLRVKERRAK